MKTITPVTPSLANTLGCTIVSSALFLTVLIGYSHSIIIDSWVITMGKELELYQSRVSQVTSKDGTVTIHFPHCYIHQAKGTGWSQEAELLLAEATVRNSTALPGMIDDGYLEMDGKHYEVIPLPLGEHDTARVHLVFGDGGTLEVAGKNPVIKLIGRAIPLEGYS